MSLYERSMLNHDNSYLCCWWYCQSITRMSKIMGLASCGWCGAGQCRFFIAEDTRVCMMYKKPSGLWLWSDSYLHVWQVFVSWTKWVLLHCSKCGILRHHDNTIETCILCKVSYKIEVYIFGKLRIFKAFKCKLYRSCIV